MIVASFVLAIAIFGGSFDSAMTNVPSASRIYPVSRGVYRMVQPDGQKKLFELVDSKDGTLLGPRPWVGKMAKGRVDIWADPEKTGGELRTGYTFINGQLRMMQADGVTYRFPSGAPSFEGDLDSLFPVQKARSWEKGSSGDIWKGDKKRLRLWFANPNSAGMLFAQVVLLFVALAIRFGAHRAWLGLCSVAAASSAVGLLCTGSRGALLGCLLGIACLSIPYLKRLFSRRGLVIVGLAVLCLGGGVLATGQAKRLGNTFTSVDAGNSLRLKVAKAAVQMFADAPFGWTSGEAPARHACLNWYVFDETHTLRTHLMTMAELGWIKGFGYLAFWVLLLGIGVAALRRKSAEPLSLLASFALAGCLNPVYRDWELWLLPGASTMLALWALRRESRRHWLTLLAGAGGVAALGVVLMIATGKVLPRTAAVSIRGVGNGAIVNGDVPKVWVVEDAAVLGGFGFPGREILAFYQQNAAAPALGYVRAVEDLPSEVDTLVLPGRAAATYLARLSETGTKSCRARRVLFLSPSVGPDAVPARLLAESDVKWLAGLFAALRAGSAYREERDWVSLRVGSELYLPGWLEEVFSWR